MWQTVTDTEPVTDNNNCKLGSAVHIVVLREECIGLRIQFLYRLSVTYLHLASLSVRLYITNREKQALCNMDYFGREITWRKSYHRVPSLQTLWLVVLTLSRSLFLPLLVWHQLYYWRNWPRYPLNSSPFQIKVYLCQVYNSGILLVLFYL